MPDRLRSAGAMTAARARAESSSILSAMKQLSTFLLGVERMVRPTLGAVFSSWRGSPNSKIPDAAFTSVKEITDVATQENWSQGKRAATLAKALDPTSPALHMAAPTDPTADTDFEFGGSSWQAQQRRESRTEATREFNSAALEEFAAAGFTHKRWVSHHDKITRPTHLAANGQTVPLSAPFIVGGEALMHPGDSAGSPGEVFNCRCVVVASSTGE